MCLLCKKILQLLTYTSLLQLYPFYILPNSILLLIFLCHQISDSSSSYTEQDNRHRPFWNIIPWPRRHRSSLRSMYINSPIYWYYTVRQQHTATADVQAVLFVDVRFRLARQPFVQLSIKLMRRVNRLHTRYANCVAFTRAQSFPLYVSIRMNKCQA